jgi:hypothetical protein
MAIIPYNLTKLSFPSEFDLAVTRFANHASILKTLSQQEKNDFINYFINNDEYFKSKLGFFGSKENIKNFQLLINNFLKTISYLGYI